MRRDHAGAQLTLSVIYEYGFGNTDADLTEALKWYELAARRGVTDVDPKLIRLHKRVRAKMTDSRQAPPEVPGSHVREIVRLVGTSKRLRV